MALLAIKLSLPSEVINAYEERGELGKVLSAQLTRTVHYTADKPMYINDALRLRLERLFGMNFQSPEDLVRKMERYVTARIGDVDVQLKPQLLQRLRTRCPSNKTFEKHLEERVILGLEEYAGMR